MEPNSGLIKYLVLGLWLCLPPVMFAQKESTPVVKTGLGKPAVNATTDLEDFDLLPGDRRKLIEGAIAVARDSPWLPNNAWGTEPSDGGFDCSGAMYFVMRRERLVPPRTSTGPLQRLKLKEIALTFRHTDVSVCFTIDNPV